MAEVVTKLLQGDRQEVLNSTLEEKGETFHDPL